MNKLFLSLFLFPLLSFSQDLSIEEQKLYDMIMEYRKKKKLPSIPLSKSLTFVAQTHTKDLIENKPDLGRYNAHSWSKNGNWTPVKYTGQYHQAKYVWNKPRELTLYKGNGYEIACGDNDCCSDFIITADFMLNRIKNSPAHNDMTINKNMFKKTKWKAIGISIRGGFAVVWFGKEEDKENT
jgi:hypothetical protein